MKLKEGMSSARKATQYESFSDSYDIEYKLVWEDGTQVRRAAIGNQIRRTKDRRVKHHGPLFLLLLKPLLSPNEAPLASSLGGCVKQRQWGAQGATPSDAEGTISLQLLPLLILWLPLPLLPLALLSFA